MNLKVAIVGCGQIAEGHIEEIRKLNMVQVVSVCDREILMAEQISERFAIARFYDDFGKMLETESPDVVHITTPPHSHVALAEKAIDAGCHVYVEKPLALNYQDSKKIIQLAIRSGKKLTVGYLYMFDPPAIAMRKLFEKGILGEPVHIESFYGYDLSGQFGSSILGSSTHWAHSLPGRLLHNNIDHLLYKITEFIKEDKLSIYATAYRKRSAKYGDIRDKIMDELRVIIVGGNISAYATFCSHARPIAHLLTIYCTKGIVSLDYVSRTVVLSRPSGVPGAIGRLLPSFDHGFQYFKWGARNVFRFIKSDFHFFAGFNHLLRLFYNSIIKDLPPPIDYRDILRISAIMDEIFAQLDNDGRFS